MIVKLNGVLKSGLGVSVGAAMVVCLHVLPQSILTYPGCTPLFTHILLDIGSLKPDAQEEDGWM